MTWQLPSFVGGVLHGLNTPKHDPWAHYKVLSLTTGYTAFHALGRIPSTYKFTHASAVGYGTLAGILVSGSTFCMGMLLTRIPTPSALS